MNAFGGAPSNCWNSRTVCCIFRIGTASRHCVCECAMPNCLPERIACHKCDKRAVVRRDAIAYAFSGSPDGETLCHNRNIGPPFPIFVSKKWPFYLRWPEMRTEWPIVVCGIVSIVS